MRSPLAWLESRIDGLRRKFPTVGRKPFERGGTDPEYANQAGWWEGPDGRGFEVKNLSFGEIQNSHCGGGNPYL